MKSSLKFLVMDELGLMMCLRSVMKLVISGLSFDVALKTMLQI